MGPISVIESRWWSTGNHSVRSLFEAVAAINYSNPSAFFYDMFADRSSLQTVFSSRAQDGTTEVVYTAAHHFLTFPKNWKFKASSDSTSSLSDVLTLSRHESMAAVNFAKAS